MSLYPPPNNPTDTIIRRGVMAQRKREAHPAVNEPAQDTLPENSSNDPE
jgi:hypothetical protein